MAPTHTRSNSFDLSTLSTPPSPRKMTETTKIHHKECFVSLKFFTTFCQKLMQFFLAKFLNLHWFDSLKRPVWKRANTFDAWVLRLSYSQRAFVLQRSLVFFDPQSGGYIGNTRVYTYIFICKQYMPIRLITYTLISFHYNYVNSLLGLFLFARYSLWRNT